jgi:hypothetical protein
VTLPEGGVRENVHDTRLSQAHRAEPPSAAHSVNLSAWAIHDDWQISCIIADQHVSDAEA